MAKVMTVKFLHYPTQAEASSRREWISSLILVSKLSVPRVAQLLNVSKHSVELRTGLSRESARTGC